VVTVATLLDDVRCTACRGYGVFIDVDRGEAVVTVRARCYTCGHDFGVVGGASRARVETLGDVDDAAADLVRSRLG